MQVGLRQVPEVSHRVRSPVAHAGTLPRWREALDWATKGRAPNAVEQEASLSLSSARNLQIATKRFLDDL